MQLYPTFMESPTIEERLASGYHKYIVSRLGQKEALITNPFDQYALSRSISHAASAAEALSGNYDLGVEIARDGMPLGYIFHLYGLPIETVRMKRKPSGVTWRPLGNLNEENVRGKRLIIFDVDAVTGRTISKAFNELSRYSPRSVDLLLFYEEVDLRVKDYFKFKKYGIPEPEKKFSNFQVTDLEETNGQLMLTHLITKLTKNTIKLEPYQCILINTRKSVPAGIRNVFTLERDFEEDKEALSRLEQKLMQSSDLAQSGIKSDMQQVLVPF